MNDTDTLDPEVADVEENLFDNTPEEIQVSEQAAEPTPEPAKSFTPEDIKSAVIQGMQQSQQHAPSQPAPLTNEEIEKALKIWRPNDEYSQAFIKSLQPDDEGKVNASEFTKVLSIMRDNLMQEAQTYTQALLQQQLNGVDQRYSPLLAEQERKRQEQNITKFTTKYKSLQPYSNLIPVAAQQLKNSGANFQTEDQVHSALASTMENMIKQFNPNFAAGSVTSSKITPAAVASQSGGGGGQKPANPNKKSANIW